MMVFEGSIFETIRVAEATEVCTITHFFRTNISWINNAWNVHDFSCLVLVTFTNMVFPGIEMLCAF